MYKRMPTVTFIRHAESIANAGGKTQDPAPIALSAKGLEDAKKVSTRIIEPPTLILTSRYVRTQQTAQSTLDKFPNVPHEVWPIEEFTYLSPPRYRGTTGKERTPAVTEYWLKADPHSIDGEGAESFAQFADRCRTVVERLRDKGEGRILAFSHQQFMTGVQWTISGKLSKPDQKTMQDFRAYLLLDSISNCGQIEFKL